MELGEEFGRLYGLEFFGRDFREGFRRGQELAREAGIYRQKFCGCARSDSFPKGEPDDTFAK